MKTPEEKEAIAKAILKRRRKGEHLTFQERVILNIWLKKQNKVGKNRQP